MMLIMPTCLLYKVPLLIFVNNIAKNDFIYFFNSLIFVVMFILTSFVVKMLENARSYLMQNQVLLTVSEGTLYNWNCC